MLLRIESTSAEFVSDTGVVAGDYVFDDPFKPYVHPLRTPGGVLMSAFMPHDHKHHRGLMYALRTPELNFWEERPTLPGERVGRQVHRGLREVVAAGARVGLRQELDWCGTGEEAAPILTELRSVHCRASTDGQAFEWSWHTRLTAQSDLTLRMSQWSIERPDGRAVNYHGLGLRLPREFGGPQADLRILVDGAPVDAPEALGTEPHVLEYEGAADGYWPVRRAGVRFLQAQANPLFILRDPFPYISMGPSNLAPRDMSRGEVLEEDYTVVVFDADPQGT